MPMLAYHSWYGSRRSLLKARTAQTVSRGVYARKGTLPFHSIPMELEGLLTRADECRLSELCSQVLWGQRLSLTMSAQGKWWDQLYA